MRTMKKRLPDAIAFITIAVLGVTFFWKFLFPVPQLLVTPDFGRSDAWHFSFPTKYLLSQSLKANSLPIWSSKMGTGFPVLAEGQTGTFFLPNLVLYKILDPVIAYNISFVLVVVSIGWGTYIFFRILNFSRLAAWFAGTTFAFSGLVMTELPHITLLQGFSMLPWVMIATHYLAQKKSLAAVCIFAVVISQQVLAGFPQAVVITLLLAGSYFVFSVIPAQAGIHPRYIEIRPWIPAFAGMTIWRDVVRFSFAILLALGLSAVQLLPSMEFLQNSSARGGFSPQDAAYFSYPLKHLITFLDPFRLGNPKFGTYPVFSTFDGSIFWENTGFIGILPLVFVALSLFHLKRRGLTRVALFFFICLALSFLLMLGSHSPLYIIYSLWPFNLFRVPSRFLWIFVVSLIVLSAIGIDRFARGPLAKSFLIICFIANTFFLMKTWENYQAIQPAQQWLAQPEIMQFLSPERRIYTIGNEITHNETFLTKGWQNMQPYYTLRNTLAPDSNVFWNIASTQVYAGRFLRRQALVDSLLKGIIQADANTATISAQAKKVINLFGVGQIISTVPISDPDVTETGTVGIIRVYQNPRAAKRTYLAHQPVLAQTLETAVRNMQEDSFVPGASVLVEQPLDIPNTTGGEAEITKETDTAVTIAVRGNPAASLLVLADTYYPGWRALVDGKETQILPVNINERGVLIDPGNHTVQFTYDPQSLKVGARISAISLLIIAMGFLRSFFGARIHPKTYALPKGLSRSRATSRLHKG